MYTFFFAMQKQCTGTWYKAHQGSFLLGYMDNLVSPGISASVLAAAGEIVCIFTSHCLDGKSGKITT
jgi:hypothetical protein